MVRPFQASFGTVREREVVVVEAQFADVGTTYGEAAALAEPSYSPEYTADAVTCLTEHLLPRVISQELDSPQAVESALARVRGHEMAKSAVIGAWSAAYATAKGQSLATVLGATRPTVPCGISLGIYQSTAELVAAASVAVDAGFRRLKLKIEPGWDLEPVEAIRVAYPDAMVTVDANAIYTRSSIDHLLLLDEFGLAFVEQPFAADDLWSHVLLQERMQTSLCLDESILSVGDVEIALKVDAARCFNLKVGRVGGVWNAKRIHDHCQAAGAPVWCGGLMESAIGQAECLALAALPGFLYPADIGPSERYFNEDVGVIGPLVAGEIAVPYRVGQPVEIDPDVLHARTVKTVEVQPR